MNRRTLDLIDEGAKTVLYTLIENDRKRVMYKLSFEAGDKSGLSPNAINRRIERMLESGLLKEDTSSNSRKISITEKGKKVAEKLKEIDKIMGGGELRIRYSLVLSGEIHTSHRLEGTFQKHRTPSSSVSTGF